MTDFRLTSSSLWSKVVTGEIVTDVKHKLSCIEPIRRQLNHPYFDYCLLVKYVEGKASIIKDGFPKRAVHIGE